MYYRAKTLLGFQSQTRTFVRDHVEVDQPLLERFGVDTRYVRAGGPRGYRVQIDADNSYLDIWGTRWQKPPSSLYWAWRASDCRADPGALRQYRWPDPQDPGRTDGVGQRARTLCERGEYAVVLDVTGFGAFEQGWALRGFENFYMDLVAEPVLPEALMQGVADYQIALYDRVLAEVGPYVHVVMVAEDLGGQDCPLISPEVYRRMIKPVQKRVWQFIKGKTDARLFLHSCGAIRTFIPDLIELGVDILTRSRSRPRTWYRTELKREFGKDLTFWAAGAIPRECSPSERRTTWSGRCANGSRHWRRAAASSSIRFTTSSCASARREHCPYVRGGADLIPPVSRRPVSVRRPRARLDRAR